MSRTLLVTGGAGFIGSALIRHLIGETSYRVVNFDKLSYAGNLEALSKVSSSPDYSFVKGDLCDANDVARVFQNHRPDAVMHLAAETHVDRSIDGPQAFVQSNVTGTFRLLEASRHYWRELPDAGKRAFRFLHVSTDEVYGSLGPKGLFSETSPFDPRSPYAASKAAADHLISAWHHTYKLPTLITNCSNNFGPYQFPEKLVPTVILKALNHERIPVYGDGGAVRDWLYVDDHVRALLAVLEKGALGETYAVGTNSEKTTLEMVDAICQLLDELAPRDKPYRDLVTFVEDRPGHDRRYAIDATKLRRTLGWTPKESFASGLRRTVSWYLDNQAWCRRVKGDQGALERLGTQV